MSALQAAVIAAVGGLLCGAAIELVMNISMDVALFRILILATVAGLMGALIVWLNEGLRGVEHAHDEARHP